MCVCVCVCVQEHLAEWDPPRQPRPTPRQLTKFVNGIQGGFRVTVLLILLIRPSLLPTRQGQHLNACTRGEAGRKIVVEM